MKPEKDMTVDAGTIDLNLLLPFQIAQLNTRLNAQARAIIARHGSLTLPQWRIIRLVGTKVAYTSTSVRKAAGIDKSQFSKTLNKLVEDGFMTQAPVKEDKRQLKLSLTPKGQAALDGLAPELDARNQHLLKSLTQNQRSAIFAAIQSLAEASKKTDFQSGIEEKSE